MPKELEGPPIGPEGLKVLDALFKENLEALLLADDPKYVAHYREKVAGAWAFLVEAYEEVAL